MSDTVKIEQGWKDALKGEFEKPYFQDIKTFLLAEKAKGKTIFPPGPLIFNAFNSTPFDKVKVVILGQDPYHNPGEAHGLCFSVPIGIKTPPSLLNIYKELERDIPGFVRPNHGCLEKWTSEGVLLLNAMLTVEKNQPASHQKIGWQTFTDAVIKNLSEQRSGIVFMLWGNFAKSKSALIDSQKHFVLSAAHPSPLAGNAFSGCAHFSKANELLAQQGKEPINWNI